MEGYQRGGGGGRMGEVVQGISSLNVRYKIDGGRGKGREEEEVQRIRGR